MAKNNFPKVLLLGNGINRAFNLCSWDGLLNELRVGDKKEGENSVPYSLRAILVSEDNVSPKIKEISKDSDKRKALYGVISCQEQRDMLQSLLDIDFDNILTTNYSYELEEATFGESQDVKDSSIKNMQQCTKKDKVKRAERKYLLHTYNEIIWKQLKKRIWHIHGEARKTESIVLGHYYYGSMLFKYKELLDRRKNRYEIVAREKIINDSWIDAFILSDVYVLGFGFDFSEIDLWWLLNRKKRENAPHGTVYYYAPGKDSDKGKIELLKTLGVTCYDLGYSLREIADDKGKEKYDFSIGDEYSFYPMFYEAAIKDIAARVNRKKMGG